MKSSDQAVLRQFDATRKLSPITSILLFGTQKEPKNLDKSP